MNTQKTYSINEFIPIKNGYYYLEGENTIYLKVLNKIEFKPFMILDYKPKTKVTNKEITNALSETINNHQLCILLGLNPSMHTYKRINKIRALLV